MNMASAKYSLKNRHTNEVYGYLNIQDDGLAVFRLADGVDAAKWNTLGFLQVNLTTRQLADQGAIYASLYARLPLRERIKDKDTNKGAIMSRIARSLQTQSLGVLTDSLKFCS